MSDPQQPPPGYYVPPAGAYAAGPNGYPPYAGYPAPTPAKGGAALGVVALILALVALILPTIIAGSAGFAIGFGLGEEGLVAAERTSGLHALAPVRGAVLWAEIAFWFGTVLGIWALVQGAIAIARRRGRVPGITAVVIAFLAVGVYFTVLFVGIALGVAAEGMPL